MICDKAKEKLKEIEKIEEEKEKEYKKRLEEGNKKKEELKEIFKFLDRKICPKCGGKIKYKVPLLLNYFKNSFRNIIDDYNCKSCGYHLRIERRYT